MIAFNDVRKSQPISLNRDRENYMDVIAFNDVRKSQPISLNRDRENYRAVTVSFEKFLELYKSLPKLSFKGMFFEVRKRYKISYPVFYRFLKRRLKGLREVIPR